jgi:hypothetical protein
MIKKTTDHHYLNNGEIIKIKGLRSADDSF